MSEAIPIIWWSMGDYENAEFAASELRRKGYDARLENRADLSIIYSWQTAVCLGGQHANALYRSYMERGWLPEISDNGDTIVRSLSLREWNYKTVVFCAGSSAADTKTAIMQALASFPALTAPYVPPAPSQPYLPTQPSSGIVTPITTQPAPSMPAQMDFLAGFDIKALMPIILIMVLMGAMKK